VSTNFHCLRCAQPLTELQEPKSLLGEAHGFTDLDTTSYRCLNALCEAFGKVAMIDETGNYVREETA